MVAITQELDTAPYPEIVMWFYELFNIPASELRKCTEANIRSVQKDLLLGLDSMADFIPDIQVGPQPDGSFKLVLNWTEDDGDESDASYDEEESASQVPE